MSRSSGETHPKKPKIAILSPSAPPVSVGGIATAHFALYQGLKDRGFQVEFLTFADFGKARSYHDSDPAIRRFGSPRFVTKLIQLLGRIWFSLRERRLHLRIYQTGDVWKARIGARRIQEHLRSSHPDIVVFPDQASPAFWLEKPSNQRWVQVSHHHAMRFVNQLEIGEHSLLDALTAGNIERTQLQSCDACVAPSSYMADVVRSFVSTKCPIEVISNLVVGIPSDNARFDVSSSRIFIPSGGSRFKGSEVVPGLIAKILEGRDPEKIEFFISGELSQLQRAAIFNKSPKARITAPGHLSHSQVLENLSRSKVCVSPTWIENQSMALLESKALGVPFVAFDVGGNRELLGPMDQVVPRGEVEALARVTGELLDCKKVTEIAWDYRKWNDRALDQWVVLLEQLMNKRT